MGAENLPDRIIQSRAGLPATGLTGRRSAEAAEGGCGVLGFAASIPIAGKHVLAASAQMHNRGNGKGGGIAMAGLSPAQAGVDAATLRSHTLLQIAYLDPHARPEVEREFIEPFFDLSQAYLLPHLDDYREVGGLEVRPPDVWRYFVRVKPSVLMEFAAQNNLEDLPPRQIEDEFVYQNSYRLNTRFYARPMPLSDENPGSPQGTGLGEKRAFVLSHGRDLSVLKIVGYAEQVVEYYRLEDQLAHVWIAHQRYPTKGRVWHPGGAHPFIGLNEALVHNGDFANYHAVCEYLRQRNIGQLFLTDTEVSVQLFDLWDRVYGYPLEITLEAMAPTTEHDFDMLPPEKRELYEAVQRTHLHGSPDGPWFFILARSLIDDASPGEDRYELLGITDTSMLRPQVFALYENIHPLERQKIEISERSNLPTFQHSNVQIGLIASERQAINACLRSLAAEDERFQPIADKYWVARGGSHTDGGAFRFAYRPASGNLECENKFGVPVRLPPGKKHVFPRQVDSARASQDFRDAWEIHALRAFDNGGAASFWPWLAATLSPIGWDEFVWALDWLRSFATAGAAEWEFALQILTGVRDRRFDPGEKKRASVLSLVDRGIEGVLQKVQPDYGRRLDWGSRHELSEPGEESKLVIDALGFPAEGEESAASWIVSALRRGWKHLIVYNWRGGRFAACGLGPDSHGVRIDLYGDVGDYAASGLDGAEVHLHGDGQDQLGQIMKSGKLVVYGDVGQTFLYGAKGGEIYVLGSAAGRPLINAVGSPRAVINGTCLDYLAESFMAGDPHNGGGFVILNGVTFDDSGRLVELETPYPGGNLFSLASGGAIYLRDPRRCVSLDQLNGGAFAEVSQEDWNLIEPYLMENERLFGISLDELLSVKGKIRPPEEVYRKVEVRDMAVLREGENR
jgi:glutamate synthase domain-containing protein 1/glutamate synthase domain-containing protein 3